jgi:hypothetical protein
MSSTNFSLESLSPVYRMTGTWTTYEQLQQKLAECQSKLSGLEPRWWDVTPTVRSYGTVFYLFASVSIVTTTHLGYSRQDYRAVFERHTKYRFPGVDGALYASNLAAMKAIEACFQVMKQEESDYVSGV